MTTDTTPTTAANTATDEIAKLKAQAKAALDQNFREITGAATNGDGSFVDGQATCPYCAHECRGSAATDIDGSSAVQCDACGEFFNLNSMPVGLRLTEHNALTELVDSAAWLANDLVDVLLKIAGGHKPIGVMRSDLARRILEAEVRLELLRDISR